MAAYPDGITVLDSSNCWTLVRSAEVGRLAIVIDGRPDIFPINFVVDHGSVVFRTASGPKLAAAVARESVAFEVDGYDAAAGEAWSVVLKGHAEEVRRLHELFDAATLPLFPWHAAPKQHFVRITPDGISGRSFHIVDSATWGTKSTDSRSAPE
jgi:hypothetical protein